VRAVVADHQEVWRQAGSTSEVELLVGNEAVVVVELEVLDQQFLGAAHRAVAVAVSQHHEVVDLLWVREGNAQVSLHKVVELHVCWVVEEQVLASGGSAVGLNQLNSAADLEVNDSEGLLLLGVSKPLDGLGSFVIEEVVFLGDRFELLELGALHDQVLAVEQHELGVALQARDVSLFPASVPLPEVRVRASLSLGWSDHSEHECLDLVALHLLHADCNSHEVHQVVVGGL